VNPVAVRQCRSLHAGVLKEDAAWRAQACHIRLHTSLDAIGVGDFGRTEPESVRFAGLLLLGGRFERLYIRRGAEAEAGDQKATSGSTKSKSLGAHEEAPRFGTTEAIEIYARRMNVRGNPARAFE
jgi:hypothetical protein